MRRARGCALITLALIALASVAFPRTAPAVEFRAGQHVVVGADEVVDDDLYATGETVTVEGRIEGDLVASGREVRVHGEVTGDLMAAGQAVIIEGTVGDDVRMAGMALRLGPSARIADDVVAAGFSFESAAGSTTQGSTLFSGFQALLAGDVDEGLRGAMSALEIQGRIGGDSAVEVEGDPAMFPFVQYLPSAVPLPAVAGGLTLGEDAVIDGRFEYTSQHEARGSSSGLGSVERTARPEQTTENMVRKPRWPGRLLRWAGLIVLGLLLAWWAPRWLDSRSGEIEARPLLSGGVGFLGVAALPIGAILWVLVVGLLAALLGLLKLGNLAALAFTLGLVVLCLLGLIFWLTASYLAPVIVGLCTGRWLLNRLASDRASGLVMPLVAGLLLLAALRFVPVLGTLAALIVVLMGWGAILSWLWQRSRGARRAL